ncbi:haloacid dehalogenase type II [Fluviibacterium sp. DFM31]|uniref:(S)-2-haloacid dehalogenase n=1 Tax=Meridianimarinicoccus marinus TaxID=3231483 RepID=A0ABV3L249_9RHOB
MPITTVVFDAYGTLFDVTAAARTAAQSPEFPQLAEVWQALARDWRAKQLEYSWLRAVTGNHTPFWEVTQDGLDWAMEANGLQGEELRARLLALYWELDAYPEVPDLLQRLKAEGLTTAILSNGSPEMLEGAVSSASLEGLLDGVLSVESCGVFKPDAAVYDLVRDQLGKRADEVLFVSSNGWDVCSAAAYGFQTLWVNRMGQPLDRLPEPPAAIEPDLSRIPDLLASGRFTRPDLHPEPQYFTASDGLRLAYRDEGEGPALLCLCGLTRNIADFDFVARDFSDRARIIRLDTRGRGQSDHDPTYLNYNLGREGLDALDLLDHLGLDKAAILGTSRGGLIALTLAVTHKDRLTGVCLNDIGPEIDPEGLAFIFGYLGIQPAFQTYDEAADALVKTTAARFPGVPRGRWRLHAERIWTETDDGLRIRYDAKLRDAVIEQSATGDVQDLWPFFDAFADLPLALIRGQHSDILPAKTAAEMRRRRPDMIHAEVPRRGHVPFLDEPEARRALSQFIDSLP